MMIWANRAASMLPLWAKQIKVTQTHLTPIVRASVSKPVCNYVWGVLFVHVYARNEFDKTANHKPHNANCGHFEMSSNTCHRRHYPLASSTSTTAQCSPHVAGLDNFNYNGSDYDFLSLRQELNP